MISIENEKVFNDDNPWSEIILRDIVTGLIYEVLMDINNDVYLESSTNELTDIDIPDIANDLIYNIFVYNHQVHIAPVSTVNGMLYGTECFSSAGNTFIMNIDRNSDIITSINDISLHLYDHGYNVFLYINYDIIEIAPNSFKIEFLVPIKGNFTSIIKIGDAIHLTESIKVQQYSYDELNQVIDNAKEELNNTKFNGYI